MISQNVNTEAECVVLLCVQLSLLSELGFGGALLYIDPCDAPAGRRASHQAFRVTLNPGGSPAVGQWPTNVWFSHTKAYQ